ncbi:MAG: Wzz/FepE/Etk N-terminal domain-containing protein, partial [Bacteroidia bacterium]
MEAKKQSIISEKDLKLLWRIVKTNWYVPIILIPIFYLGGLFYTHRLTDISRASTQILLKHNDAYYQNNLVTDAGFYNNSSFVDNSNESRVIQSYDIMKEVMRRLKDRLQVSYFTIGRVRTEELFRGIPFTVKVNTVKSNWYEVPIDFKILDYDNYELSFFDGTQARKVPGQFNKELLNAEIGCDILITRGDLITKASVKEMTLTNYQLVIHSMEYLIGQFQGNMMVENLEYTNILQISINDIIPERAILVLDTINKVYAENSLKSKYELNEKTLVYINKQIDEIKFDLRNIEDTMQDYKERHNILDLEWEQSDYFGKIAAYDNKRTELRLETEALNDLEKYIIEDKD